MPELITKNGFPKKVFGELTLKGGLNSTSQIIKIKYLLPTKEYPTGKAVIEIIVPDSINTFILSNNDLKPIMEINRQLAMIASEIANDETKQIIAQQINFNQKLINIASDAKKKPHIAKSFRFNEKDYIETHILMSYLAQLFGYLFYKNKTEIEKENNVQHLMASRDAVATFMSENVFKKFKAGFMEGYGENR